MKSIILLLCQFIKTIKLLKKIIIWNQPSNYALDLFRTWPLDDTTCHFGAVPYKNVLNITLAWLSWYPGSIGHLCKFSRFRCITYLSWIFGYIPPHSLQVPDTLKPPYILYFSSFRSFSILEAQFNNSLAFIRLSLFTSVSASRRNCSILLWYSARESSNSLCSEGPIPLSLNLFVITLNRFLSDRMAFLSTPTRILEQAFR